jgi:hypothetical protein
MGGVFGEIAYIQQEVLIYAGTPYLSYWHWVDSSETSCGNDTASVIINTDVVEHFGLCQYSSTAGWVQRSVDLNAYTGGKATLVFRVATNNNLNSNYFIDDVTFETSPVLMSNDKPALNLTTSPVMKP